MLPRRDAPGSPGSPVAYLGAIARAGEYRGCRFYEPVRAQGEGVHGLEGAFLVDGVALVQGVERLHEARDALEEAAGGVEDVAALDRTAGGVEGEAGLPELAADEGFPQGRRVGVDEGFEVPQDVSGVV